MRRNGNHKNIMQEKKKHALHLGENNIYVYIGGGEESNIKATGRY